MEKTLQQTSSSPFTQYVDPTTQPSLLVQGVGTGLGSALAISAQKIAKLVPSQTREGKAVRLGLSLCSLAGAYTSASLAASRLVQPQPSFPHQDPTTHQYYAPGSLILQKDEATGEYHPISRETTDLTTGEKKKTFEVVVGFTGQSKREFEENVVVRDSEGNIASCRWNRDQLWTTQARFDMQYATEYGVYPKNKRLAMVTAQLTAEEYEVVKTYGYQEGFKRLGFNVSPDMHGNNGKDRKESDVTWISQLSVVVESKDHQRFQIAIKYPTEINIRSHANFLSALPRGALALFDRFKKKWPGVVLSAEEGSRPNLVVKNTRSIPVDQTEDFKKDLLRLKIGMEQKLEEPCLRIPMITLPEEEFRPTFYTPEVQKRKTSMQDEGKTDAALEEIARRVECGRMTSEQASQQRVKIFAGERAPLMRKKGASEISTKEAKKAQREALKSRMKDKAASLTRRH